MPDPASKSSPSLADLALVSAKIGVLGFGGPAGQIALMHKVFVDEKNWVDEDRYLYALSYCTLLPGPEAQQLATYIGWLLHGVRGGLIAGTLFVVPGALAMLALSWLYMLGSQTPVAEGILYGVRAVVLALIVQSSIKIGRKSLSYNWAKAIALASFLALAIGHIAFPIVIATAAIIGALIAVRAPKVQPVLQHSPRQATKSLQAAAIWIGLWLFPLVALLLSPQGNPLLRDIAALFSGLSLVTFGGAYTATAWLNQQAVVVYGWLSANQMIDGLALVQAIPGPLVLVNQHVGFIAGWNQGGIGMAIAGALLASWCTFAPSFVWIFAGAPFAERLRENPFVATALKAVNAAVVGVVASLAFWFGLQLLFQVTPTTGAVVDWHQFDSTAALITLAAFGLLSRTKLPLPTVLALGAFSGFIVRSIS
jgi:chromate transporter